MTFRQRALFLGSLDAFIVFFSVMTIYLLRFDFAIPSKELLLLPAVIGTHILFNLIGFHIMKLYQRVWQYASIGEVTAILKMTSLAEAGCFFLYQGLSLYNPEWTVPKSVYLSWALIILGVGGSRFAWRMFRDTFLINAKGQTKRLALIIGAGRAGVMVAKELRYSKASSLLPVALIDDDRSKHHLQILGLPIIGGREVIHQAVKTHNIDDIVIAIPSAPRTEIAKIIDICKTTKATVKMLPNVSELINGNVSIEMIRDVQVEDLLGREPVKLDMAGIASYVSDQVVLVTGAGGSIGSELCRQILPFAPNSLLLLGHGENSIYEIDMELRKSFPEANLVPVIADIQDRRRLEEIFEKYRPNIVFHAAAHKHVPLMENNPLEAVKNNYIGTKHVAECADAYHVSHFVMVSTDKAVNPTSMMGATKRLAEMFIQQLGSTSSTKYAAVRFGNVLGSRGSVIPVFKKQIQQGGPVTVTHPDMVRYFMTIPEAVQLVIQAGALAKGGEIFILDMGEPVKIVNLAKDLISLSGLRPGIDIQIEYSGIRPGEKLFEELLTKQEGVSATKHDRIFISKPIPYEWSGISAKLAEIEWLTAHSDDQNRQKELKQILFQLLPEYKAQVQLQEESARMPVLS